MRRMCLFAALVFTSACGTDLLVYQSVVGSYSGTFSAMEAGGSGQYDGSMGMTLSQVDDMMTGTWEIDGTITDGGTTAVMVEGDVFGTLPVGDNPTFSVWLTYDDCPNDLMAFTMSYDSQTQELTLGGDLEILSGACVEETEYQLFVTLD